MFQLLGFFLPFLLCCSLAADPVWPKKVILISVPKAGTHLLKKAIKILDQRKAQWLPTYRFSSPDLERILLTSRNRYFMVHLFSDADPVLYLNPRFFTKILMVRDPRDVMVSFLHYLAKNGTWPFSPQFDQTAFKTLTLDEQLSFVLQLPPYGPSDAILIAAKWIHSPDFTVIRFEDLVGEEGGGSEEAQERTLHTLAHCLEIPLTDAKLAELKCSLFGGTLTFQNGQIGKWHMTYSNQNKALFKSLLGQATIALGYAQDLDW
jgi:hypothetical protein